MINVKSRKKIKKKNLLIVIVIVLTVLSYLTVNNHIYIEKYFRDLFFFYFDYIKPFDYQLEETSSILAKVLLSKGFEDAGFLMLTEGIGFDHQEEIRKVKKIGTKYFGFRG